MSSKHHKISKGIYFKGVLSYPSDAQAGDVVYRSDLQKLMFFNGTAWAEIGGSGGGASSLIDLDDTNISSPSDQQVLSYNQASGKWINSTISSGGQAGTYPVNTPLSIANNVTNSNLGISYTAPAVRSIILDIFIARKTDTSSANATGQAFITYDDATSTWSMTTTGLSSSGISLEINSVTGVLTYTSSNLSGANYVGSMYYSSTINGGFQIQQPTTPLDFLLNEDFDNKLTSNFSNTGMQLSSNTINGYKTALLTHQPSASRNFTQSITVSKKFRGKNLTLKLYKRSTAQTANLTLTVVDITNSNATLISEQISTNSVSFSGTTVSGSPTITVSNSDSNLIEVGASVTGTGIPAESIAISKTPTTVTISANASTSATNTLKASSLPSFQNFSFDIPKNCQEISYTTTALQESGSPESYIDDVQVFITEVALSNTSVTVPKAVENEYAARIANNGTATITSQTSTFIQSINGTGTGTIVVNFVAGIFTVTPSVVANISDNNASFVVQVLASSTSSCTIEVRDNGGTQALSDQDFNIIVTKQGIDYINPLTSTETKTIPLTSSVLVTESDSQIKANGNSGQTITSVVTNIPFANPIVIGSGLQFNGDSVTVLESGLIDVRGQIAANAIAATQAALLYVNGVQRYRLVEQGYSSSFIPFSFKENFNVGDVISIRSGNTITLTNGATDHFIEVTKVGSTKILNPSSDQKIDIPTHELRFEGASARGSVATAIVKFDTLAKIKGDGFEVVNTSADGTYVRIKKAGRLSVGYSLSGTAGGNLTGVSLNQSILTTVATTAETIAMDMVASANYGSGSSATVEVKVGDIIRVYSEGGISSGDSRKNQLTLNLMETSVAVALQNVAPRWDDSDSAVRVQGGNGYGSTGTKIRRFSNIIDNLGSAIEYTDSVINGASFLIKEDGDYSITYGDGFNTASSYFGITKNSTMLSTNVSSADGILSVSTSHPISNTFNTVPWSGRLLKGDVIRPHSEGNASGSVDRSYFSISKVGKTQGTVDVTPFVQIPQSVSDSLNFRGNASTWLDSTNEIRFPVSAISTTNNGVIKIEDDVTNTRTKFVAITKCTITANFSYSVATAGWASGIYKNGAQAAFGTTVPVAGYLSLTSYTTVLEAGEFISMVVLGGGAVSSDTSVFSITATALSPSIATPTEQVSSDTMNFVFKPTAIVDSDPIGTFNTYKKVANTQTSATLCTTAPSQTVSSMNTNGVLVTPANYATATTDALPSRFDIKIGKGLKSWSLEGYGSTGKLTELITSLFPYNSSETYGILSTYSATTGILTLEAGNNNSNVITSRAYLQKTGITGSATGYFVFNASKSPSLVSIPNFTPRIALVKYDTPSARMTLTTTFTAVPLTSSQDPTGIVAVNTNQITLQPGQYLVEINAYFYTATSLQQCFSKFRNVTDTVDEFYLMPMSSGTNGINQTIYSGGSKIVTVNTTKAFDVLARVSSGTGYIGDTYGTEADKLVVKITKLK